MDHNFNVDVACVYGLPAAVFIHNLYFWILKNEANGRHFYDGRNWTYNSVSALAKLFPYFSQKQIRTIIDKCVASGAIVKGNYNKSGYDHTNWYALGDDVLEIYGGYTEGKTISPSRQHDLPKQANQIAQTGEPIPDNKPDSKPDIDKKYKGATAPKFKQPSVFEVRDYCQEKGYQIDPEAFVDYYIAKGWRIGKTPMKDWKAAVRNWERRRKDGSDGRSAQKPQTDWGIKNGLDL